MVLTAEATSTLQGIYDTNPFTSIQCALGVLPYVHAAFLVLKKKKQKVEGGYSTGF